MYAFDTQDGISGDIANPIQTSPSPCPRSTITQADWNASTLVTRASQERDTRGQRDVRESPTFSHASSVRSIERDTRPYAQRHHEELMAQLERSKRMAPTQQEEEARQATEAQLRRRDIPPAPEGEQTGPSRGKTKPLPYRMESTGEAEKSDMIRNHIFYRVDRALEKRL